MAMTTIIKEDTDEEEDPAEDEDMESEEDILERQVALTIQDEIKPKEK
jgi:hypothetical protein